MCLYEVKRREVNTKIIHPPLAYYPRHKYGFLSIRSVFYQNHRWTGCVSVRKRRIFFPVDSLVHPSHAKIVFPLVWTT